MKQHEIVKEFHVKKEIDPKSEIQKRIEFIKGTLRSTGRTALVLGISGGVDSAVAGKLSQMAVNDLNGGSGGSFKFIAMRLPHGEQKDEVMAQASIEAIQPSCVKTTNIEKSVEHMLKSIETDSFTAEEIDFAKGNIKARARMVAQYAIAGLHGGLVVGTDHSAEGVMGFFTKFGDGACDLAPLFGLNKRQVRMLAQELGFPEEIYNKEATADLEELRPQLSDEHVLGVTYNEIDDFLEGKEVSEDARNTIIETYMRTKHKRDSVRTIYEQ